jgi:hypothetical protein
VHELKVSRIHVKNSVAMCVNGCILQLQVRASGIDKVLDNNDVRESVISLIGGPTQSLSACQHDVLFMSKQYVIMQSSCQRSKESRLLVRRSLGANYFNGSTVGYGLREGYIIKHKAFGYLGQVSATQPHHMLAPYHNHYAPTDTWPMAF